jgi:hypothetical protein
VVAVDPLAHLDAVWNEMLPMFGVAPSSLPSQTLGPPPALVENAPTVYLDTNHWVTLAKARLNRSDAAHASRCYELLQSATTNGRLRVVLSTASYQEVARAVPTIRQRSDLADVMSEITRFQTIRQRSDLIGMQVEQALHERFGRPMFPSRLEVFGFGVGFAFSGTPFVPSIVGDLPQGAATMADLFGGEDAYNELLSRTSELMEYLCLRGPRPEDLPNMPGYDLTPINRIEKEQAEREQELADMLAGDPQLKSRLSDIVVARELYWELGHDLARLLWSAGVTVDSFFYKGKEWVTDFVESLPSFAVRKALKMRSFKNASRAWTPNDMRDLEHLSLAVPYCDVVVTEKHATAVLTDAGLDKALETRVVADLSELERFLESPAIRSEH